MFLVTVQRFSAEKKTKRTSTQHSGIETEVSLFVSLVGQALVSSNSICWSSKVKPKSIEVEHKNTTERHSSCVVGSVIVLPTQPPILHAIIDSTQAETA